MWVGQESITNNEILAKYFIAFTDMEKDSVVHKSGRNNYRNITMSPEIIRWCRDGKMNYRKITVYDLVIIENDGYENKHCRRQGLLFYSEENAMAFKLRWC